jgi:type 1 fimbria pilin
MISGVSVGAGAPFSIAGSTCAGALAPKKTCKVTVVFSPTAKQSFSGTLTVRNNADNNSQLIGLQGTGK